MNYKKENAEILVGKHIDSALKRLESAEALEILTEAREFVEMARKLVL